VGIVDIRVENGLAWVTINNPPVNATSTAVRRGLLDAVARVQGCERAILHCTGRSFIAGGDMSEFDAPPREPHLPDVVDAIEASQTPFIAAMHGNVLGGGLEIAMACAHRVAAPGTKFGLPEVNVGLVPGAGGSQRAPRLFGWEAAIDMACSGKMLSAKEALDLGAIDAIDEDIAALAQTISLSSPVPVSQRHISLPDSDWIEGKRAALDRRARGQAAPLAQSRCAALGR
jgi:3-hydroxyacyl-CoA dehydrogenase